MRKKQTPGQKKEQMESLRQSESWLRLIMDNTSDGILITEYNPKTDKRRLIMCNDRYVEMSGRSKEELMRSEDLNEFLRWKKARSGFLRDRLAHGARLEGTASWLRPDGKEDIHEWTSTILKIGDKYHVVGIERDITERVKDEERLRRLAMIADQAAEGIAVVDLDGTFQFVNMAWARMHGYETGQELVGKHLSVCHTPEQMKTYVNPFNEEVKLNGRHVGESEQMRKDGTTFPSEMIVSLFRDEEGNPIGFLAFAIDITERKQAEEALHASELQYRTTLDSIVDAIHVVGKDLRIILCNSALEQWRRQLGLESNPVGLTVFEAFPFLPESVRDEYHNVFQTGKTFIREETFTIDNKKYSTEARKIPILNRGKVIQIITVLRDITGRKQSEEALRDSEETARALLNATLDLVLLIKPDGTILAVNEIAAKRFGKPVSELIGENVRDVHQPDIAEQRLAQSDKVVRTGKPLRFEDEHDGRWLNHSICPVFDLEGKVVRLAIFVSDITDRKKAEDALRNSEDNLRKRVRELNCLYQITEVVNACGDDIDALLQGIVDILPESCRHPKNACARITFGQKKYATDNFMQSTWNLAADILIAGEKAGVLEVFFLDEKPTTDEILFLKEERSLIDAIAARIGRNIERIQAQQRLIAEQSALYEKNVALREVMAGIQDEKKEFSRRVIGNVEKIIMPMLHTLEHELPQGQRKYLNLLRESIEDITLPFADNLSREFASLTPTEIRICNLIRRGIPTKEIADLHHISPATVNKHREHIRRKLRITNKNINLETYLTNYMSAHQ
ncbi:MAG: PAS domain S-box protein [Planctomycetota bacterium]|nr:PAS domain S-box protein [Planctomycetota bacterium]